MLPNLGTAVNLPRVDTGRFSFGKVNKAERLDAGLPWDVWLKKYLGEYVGFEFADRHKHLWRWVEEIEKGQRPRPFSAYWPRGGGKSSTAELAVVRVGFRRVRRYGWYISGTQDKADRHVETIASILESPGMEKCDPALASRKVGKYGHSKGWRRSRVWTASNFTVDALGLDVGSRGAKVEEARPDFFVIDDVDDKHDGLDVIKRKIETITTSILPAGSRDCAILFVQNIIHPNSIAARLAGIMPFDDGQEFLTDRINSGPYPAVDGLAYESRYDPALERQRYFITSGTATWNGQSREICEQQILDWGLTAFLQEAQHEVEQTGGIWDHIEFQHIDAADLPGFVRTTVWVDPAVTSTDESDSMGIQAAGITEKDVIIMLYSWEAITSPVDAIKRAIRKAMELGATTVGVETDQGGDTWQSVYYVACEELRAEMWPAHVAAWEAAHPEEAKRGTKPPPLQFPSFKSDKAGAGYGSKVERNQRMLTDYEGGRVLHLTGPHAALERSLRRFPRKPLDLADAAFWAWHDLRDGSAHGGIFV